MLNKGQSTFLIVICEMKKLASFVSEMFLPHTVLFSDCSEKAAFIYTCVFREQFNLTGAISTLMHIYEKSSPNFTLICRCLTDILTSWPKGWAVMHTFLRVFLPPFLSCDFPRYTKEKSKFQRQLSLHRIHEKSIVSLLNPLVSSVEGGNCIQMLGWSVPSIS